MRVFASWSGEESRQIAELLKSWIPSVVQDAEVYVSSQDIGKGERWLASVSSNLAEIDFGIIIVTRSNVNAPWILFEAGALSKSVKGIVVPLLCGVENFEAAKSPLTQFQYATVAEGDLRDLVLQINSFCEKPLEQARIEASFKKWWPDFNDAYNKIEHLEPKAPKKETDSTRLENIENAMGEVMNELKRMRVHQDSIPLYGNRLTYTDLPSPTGLSPSPALTPERLLGEVDSSRQVRYVGKFAARDKKNNNQ